MKTEKKRIKFIATVDDDKIDSVKLIASNLKKSGVTVDQVLTISGIITGHTTDLKGLNKFKSMGLKSIEKDEKKKAW